MRCQCCMRIFFRLRSDGWYCVTKGRICLFATKEENRSKTLLSEQNSHSHSWSRAGLSTPLFLSRGYPGDIVKKTISSVLFKDRQSALQPKQKANKQILPFVTQYNPSLLKLKKILMQHWHLIQNQPLLKGIFTEPPTTSYKRGKSLKDTLVRAKLT